MEQERAFYQRYGGFYGVIHFQKVDLTWFLDILGGTFYVIDPI